MSKSLIRKSLPLAQDEWQNLEDLAEKLQVLSPTGTSHGQPSWRSMMKAIANGEFVLLLAGNMTEIQSLLLGIKEDVREMQSEGVE